MNLHVLLVIACTAAMISVGAASVPSRSPPLETYLGGRWLVRPVRPDNWVQPYTHEAQIQSSSVFDGELSVNVRPFFGVDAATGVMATAAKSIGDTLGPPFYAVVGELLSLVAVATGTPTTVVADRMATVDEPSSFAAWDQCRSSSSAEQLSYLSAHLRNISFDVKLNMESGVNGMMTFVPVAVGCEDHPQADTAPLKIGEQQSSRDAAHSMQFHVSIHHAPTEFQKYRTITTVSKDADSQNKKISPQCIRIPVNSGGDACSEHLLPVAIWSYSVHVIDDSNILLHMVTRTGLTCSLSSNGESSSGPYCPISFALKRTTQSHEDRELWSTVGTLLLLLVVALVKFGPRWYMNWRGISPHSIGAATRGTKYGPLPTAGKPDLLQHAEILQAAKRRQ